MINVSHNLFANIKVIRSCKFFILYTLQTKQKTGSSNSGQKMLFFSYTSKQIFHYTRCITPQRVTSLRQGVEPNLTPNRKPE